MQLVPVRGKGVKTPIQSQKQRNLPADKKILPESYISDPDLAKIVKIWPVLPEHIKTAIKALVQAHEGGV